MPTVLGQVACELIFICQRSCLYSSMLRNCDHRSMYRLGRLRVHSSNAHGDRSLLAVRPRTVVLTPTTDYIKALQGKARGIDQAMATSTAFHRAMLGQLFTNCGRTADIGLDGRHIGRGLGGGVPRMRSKTQDPRIMAKLSYRWLLLSARCPYQQSTAMTVAGKLTLRISIPSIPGMR